jgi:hypothetical protein
MSRASKPAKQNGTSSAETIRASGQRPREQAGHKTAPDQHARPSQTPCNAGAIHTGRSLVDPSWGKLFVCSGTRRWNGLGCTTCRDLNLDLYAPISQTCFDHGCGRPHISKRAPKRRPAGGKVIGAGQDVPRPDHVGEIRPCLLKGILDVDQALLDLLRNIIGYRHRSVIEPCRARNKNPFAVNDCSRIADVVFER